MIIIILLFFFVSNKSFFIEMECEMDRERGREEGKEGKDGIEWKQGGNKRK